MRAGILVTTVLAGGTVLVFAAAALTASLFPSGTVVNSPWGAGWSGGWRGPEPVPMLERGAPGPWVIDEKMPIVVDEEFQPLPGDTVAP